ncbi:MAG: tetratricopeptide repeat protein [Myxococcota bacterium]
MLPLLAAFAAEPACEGARACLEEGLRREVAREFMAAEAAYVAGCAAASGEACRRASWRVENGPLPREAEALALARRGCELLDARACLFAARVTGERDLYARTLELARKGCATGATPDCGLVAIAEVPAEEAALARARLLAHFQGPCAAGEPDACYAMAEVATTPQEAVPPLKRACELGSWVACHEFRIRTRTFPSEVGDRLLANAEADCLAGASRLCEVAVINGVLQYTDPPRAERLRRRACELGDADACLFVDRARARVLDDRYCEAASHGPSCARAGEAWIEGRDGPVDVAVGIARLERACELGHAQGCADLAWQLSEGERVPDDLPRAKALYARACDLGAGWVCWLAK